MTNSLSGIAAHRISKFYKKRPVVRDVSLNLEPGEIVGLLGPNGSGKTTCFSIIAGLVKADAGDIRLNDKLINDYPIYKRARMGISYLPQESSIFRGLTVYENLIAVLEIIEKDVEFRHNKAEELLIEFAINHLKNTPAIALSGGERRRLEIARMIAVNPKYILLDEPFAGIDPVNIHEIKNMILQLKTRDIGILITDHNVKDTFNIVDRAYIMYEGKILTQGNVSEIISSEEVKNIYLGDSFKI